jgi:hypothetical protein
MDYVMDKGKLVKIEKKFGAQGKSKQVKKAEEENLTDEQKVQSKEREVTFKAGYEKAKKEEQYKEEELKRIEFMKTFKGIR